MGQPTIFQCKYLIKTTFLFSATYLFQRRCVGICTASRGNTVFALEVVAVVLVEVVGLIAEMVAGVVVL